MPHLVASNPPLTTEAIIEAGRRVVATEAEALWLLVETIGDEFAQAVRILHTTRGRVIVCGLGKSGNIAHKTAATLTATGTPSTFLHAGDAVHGDLGTLMPGDTLLLLSNSGDTREFGVIIRRAKALALPILAITSSTTSPVAQSADVAMILPPAPEACPFGSSPTTSTTMMITLGDALALTLMGLRDTKASDLLALHPGGRLGLDLVRIDSFMHTGDALPLVDSETAMTDVLELISQKGFGVAGVVDPRGRLAGVITDGDIRRTALGLPQSHAGAVMTRNPRTLIADAMARDALAIMSESRITSLFVIDNALDGNAVGLVHIHDLLRLGIG